MLKLNYQIRSLTTRDFLSLYWSLVLPDVAIFFHLMFETNKTKSMSEKKKKKNASRKKNKINEETKRRRKENNNHHNMSIKQENVTTFVITKLNGITGRKTPSRKNCFCWTKRKIKQTDGTRKRERFFSLTM